MAEIEELEMRAAEDRARLKIALGALSDSTRGASLTTPLTGLAQAQAGRLSRGAMGAARRNPAAAALVGLGAGLFATGAGKRSDDDQDTPEDGGRGKMLTIGALALGAGALAAALLPRKPEGDADDAPE
ncbi:hypothetical protein KUW09_06665 [Mameliella alba]|nr:hypothetical protein [Antarctobacter heliothermus]MBY6143718.1 hypothetical protein [Mameliella alba]MCA0952558.1 hypothetical protein [Mameliella alba]